MENPPIALGFSAIQFPLVAWFIQVCQFGSVVSLDTHLASVPSRSQLGSTDSFSKYLQYLSLDVSIPCVCFQ